jgi:hypothetical protein
MAFEALLMEDLSKYPVQQAFEFFVTLPLCLMFMQKLTGKFPFKQANNKSLVGMCAERSISFILFRLLARAASVAELCNLSFHRFTANQRDGPSASVCQPFMCTFRLALCVWLQLNFVFAHCQNCFIHTFVCVQERTRLPCACRRQPALTTGSNC